MSASRLRKLAESREGAIKFIVVSLQLSVVGGKSRENICFLSFNLQNISTFALGFGAPSPFYRSVMLVSKSGM